MVPTLLDPSGIHSIVNKLRWSSSCDIDGITSKFLQATAEYSYTILNLILTKSLNNGSLPKNWKTGKVILLHKAGDRHNSHKYRPISLTPIPCKIFEHVIFSHLVNFLEWNGFFHNSQHHNSQHRTASVNNIKLTLAFTSCLLAGSYSSFPPSQDLPR